ncbi:DUF6470 family protein [Vreelandella salicampi]|uniref:PRC-barrel domain-containing protein n=1 Tax=Vreelandella salicampi TaxID=1449798 RepID=A0A7Z0RW32_9GAMM|nr:PRC-barrel domain-containing protein [Halomonas salicampi]NYS62228.1 PRC-barrel domain-containing protein [Halomonas salicampi]
MKRTAIAIAVGALSFGLTQGLHAQDEESQANEQKQTNPEGTQGNEQGQGAKVRIEGEPADVDIEQEPAEIQVEQKSPNVTVEQQPPEVTIEQPDPNVTVEQAEPNITVEEPGEVDVEIESAENVDAEMRDTDEQNQDEASQDQASKGNAFIDREVREIEGYTVYSQEDDEEIGDIERVVRNTQSNDIYVVITEGGFFGFGEDEMGYKVDDLELRNDDELVVRSSDDGESGDYGSDQFENIDTNQTLREAMQSN